MGLILILIALLYIRNQQHYCQGQNWPLLNSKLSGNRSDSRLLLQVIHRLKVAARFKPYRLALTGIFGFPPFSNRALLKQSEDAIVNMRCLNFVEIKTFSKNKLDK